VPVAPHGTWPSPLSAELLAGGGVRVDGPAQRADEVWWCELRPAEAGRSALVVRTGGVGGTPAEVADALSEEWSVRSLVHEYGGGAWWLGRDTVYFTNLTDQCLYRLDAPGAQPVALTPEPPAPRSWRYADGREHPGGGWVVCVRERHPVGQGEGSDGDGEAVNELVAIRADGSDPLEEPRVLGLGPDGAPMADFVAAPRLSADGRWMSWIRWNHPRMPWDGTELCVAPVFGGLRLGNIQVIAGNDGEAIHGADWTSDGRLVFSTDASGWWNLHAWTPGSDRPHAVTDLTGSEIGAPQWAFGTQQWAELSDGRLVAIVTTDATDALGVLPGDGTITMLDTPYVDIRELHTTDHDTILVNAATTTETAAVVELDPAGNRVTVHRPPDDVGIDPAWFSQSRAFTCPVTGAASGSPDREVHAFVYPPTGPGYEGPAGERPPLVVMGHGGPTAHAPPGLNLRIQYWTSRGFAVADVNYGGSSGFGRAYRRLLDGAWGVVDVEDCIAVASALAAEGVVDPQRLAIRGGSAGGFTVLAALTGSQVFTAGTSLYGIADLEALARDTHKFESRYLDGLIGPYPERRDIYVERSPINHTGSLSCPLLVLQGLEDEIVPPNQAEAIVAAAAAKGLPHAYVAFEGEQHGFRQAANIIRSYELELWFYSRVFGFEAADDIDPPAGAVGL
jgi:dipeptidyl aminopeptidase/acylaminoacyl peptidase